MARKLADLAGMFKIGSQLFTAEGPRAVNRIASLGRGIFLDFKFHDIPNTVAGAVGSSACLPGVRMVNLHALGGVEMMRAGVRALKGRPRAHRRSGGGRSGARPWLLGVTILTSLGAKALRQVGISGTLNDCAARLAVLSRRAGLDGVVASPHEVAHIRRVCGKGFLIVVPGIRPAGPIRLRRGGRGGKADDQSRVATPAEAIRAGADYLVVGRPIITARDPQAAARSILAEIAGALSARI